MKKSLTILLCSIALQACGQQVTSGSAPVTIVFSTYQACVQGTLMSFQKPKDPHDLAPYFGWLHEYCNEWAFTWFPALSANPRELTKEELDRLEGLEIAYLDRTAKEVVRYFYKSGESK